MKTRVTKENAEFLAKILEEILVQGNFYRSHCHKCMYWHANRGCALGWHGCYYVQEELENRIEAAQKAAARITPAPCCGTCPFHLHKENCRMLCTRKLLILQGIPVAEVAVG